MLKAIHPTTFASLRSGGLLAKYDKKEIDVFSIEKFIKIDKVKELEFLENGQEHAVSVWELDVKDSRLREEIFSNYLLRTSSLRSGVAASDIYHAWDAVEKQKQKK